MCWPTPESQMSLLQANVKFFMVWAFRSVLKQDTQYSHYFPFIAMAACYCQGLTLRYSSDLFKCKMSGVCFTQTSYGHCKTDVLLKISGYCKGVLRLAVNIYIPALLPSLLWAIRWAWMVCCSGLCLCSAKALVWLWTSCNPHAVWHW